MFVVAAALYRTPQRIIHPQHNHLRLALLMPFNLFPFAVASPAGDYPAPLAARYTMKPVLETFSTADDVTTGTESQATKSVFFWCSGAPQVLMGGGL
jgi:hypothetical protein